jgi:uncharacterized membrane protein (DUF2068 family)
MGVKTEVPRAGMGGMFGLRAVALFEAAKGAIVLVAGSGLLFFVHHDWQVLADGVVRHLHLNPASRESKILLRAASHATPGMVRLLAVAALAYATFRFIEAWGLWRARRWAEWLGVLTGLIYVPFEIASFFRHPRLVPLVALAINILAVWILARQLRPPAAAPDVGDVPLQA